MSFSDFETGETCENDMESQARVVFGGTALAIQALLNPKKPTTDGALFVWIRRSLTGLTGLMFPLKSIRYL